MKNLLLTSLLLIPSPLFAHTTSYTTETCYKNIVREEYIPPHQSHYGEGYINRYYDKVQIPCGVVHHHSHIEKPVAYQNQKTSKCTGNTTLGALAGGVGSGMEGAISAKTVTYDFERLMDDAQLLKCSEFGDAIISHM